MTNKFAFIVCFFALCIYELPAFAKQPSLPSEPCVALTKDVAREQILFAMAGEWVSRATYVAAKLEIADHLKDGPKAIQELADLTQTDMESLQRLMHLLASFAIFEEQTEGVFANNEASKLLVKSNPESLHALSVFYGEDIHAAWDQLVGTVQTGTPAFQLKFKQPVFAYFKDNPARAALFQEAMKEKSTAVIKSSLSSYNFGKFKTIYDIGGGYGHFMSAILNIHPQVQGLVFDLPDVINAIPQKNPHIDKERCELVSGDFFVSIPKGADAYLLKSIIHDWDDIKAGEILKNCHDAMDANSKLLLVEVVLMPKHQSLYANCMDLLMMSITGGKERSLAAFEQILNKSGFELVKVYPTSTEFSILEARKK